MGDQTKLLSAINLLTKLPPSKIANNIAAVGNLIPDLQEQFLQKVDQPLELETDPKTGNQFFKCEFNRDGDSYRSPYSNEYVPPLEGANKPSEKIRDIELKAQSLFEEYYDTGIVNVFAWETTSGFGLAVLIKKECDSKKGVKKGVWDSINLVQVTPDGKTTKYKVTSTIVLEIAIQNEKTGDVVISGHLSKPKEETIPGKDDLDNHLAEIGRLVEDNETMLRSHMENIYFGKTKEIVSLARFEEGAKDTSKLAQKVKEGMMAKNG